MNNMYPNNPLGFYNPYLSQMNQQQFIPNYQPVSAPPPHMEIQRVNGKESAMSYAMGPNSSVVLVDNLAPKIWLVTTDSSGFKAVTGFRIIPDEEDENGYLKAPEGPTAVENPIEKLSKRMDELEERMNRYGKSDYKSAGPDKSRYPNGKTTDWHGKNGEGSSFSNSADVGE